MKKFLCATLCLCLLCGVSACGSDDPDASANPEIELPDVVVSEPPPTTGVAVRIEFAARRVA